MALPIPPEAYELSAWARRLGVDDPLPYLRELSLIDTDALRDVGTRVWGLAYRDSRFSENLADRAQRMWDRLLEDVGPTWSSRAAYPAFKDWMETIRDGSASEMVAPDAVAGWDAARSWRPGKEGR